MGNDLNIFFNRLKIRLFQKQKNKLCSHREEDMNLSVKDIRKKVKRELYFKLVSGLVFFQTIENVERIYVKTMMC